MLTFIQIPPCWKIKRELWAEPADATRSEHGAACTVQVTPRVFSIWLRIWAEPADTTQREQHQISLSLQLIVRLPPVFWLLGDETCAPKCTPEDPLSNVATQ